MSPHLLLSRPVLSGCVAPARLTRLGRGRRKHSRGRLEIQGEPSVYFSAAGSQRDLACFPASDYLGVLSSGCPLDLGGELGGLGVEAEPPSHPHLFPRAGGTLLGGCVARAGRVAAFGEARAEGLGMDRFPRCLRLCFALSLCCLLWCRRGKGDHGAGEASFQRWFLSAVLSAASAPIPDSRAEA